MKPPHTALGLAAALFLSACSSPLNFTNPDGPRYTGRGGDRTVSWNPRTGELTGGRGSADTLNAERVRRVAGAIHVVSFNIKYSKEVSAAIRLLQNDPNLNSADILLLQEMDEPGTREIASAFGYWWVYYPATISPTAEKPFGNAVLSRFPIREDHKVLLPNLGRFGKTARIGTAATLDVDGVPVRVYSLHFATVIEVSPGNRREQAEALAADAERFPGAVIIGGDLNAKSLGEIFERAGHNWITKDLGKTTKLASLDHIFVKELEPVGVPPVGKLADSGGASDHVPIWARVKIPAGATRSDGDARGNGDARDK